MLLNIYIYIRLEAQRDAAEMSGARQRFACVGSDGDGGSRTPYLCWVHVFCTNLALATV